MKMFDLRSCLFVCVNLFLYAECSIPVEKLCVNPLCTEPISKARGSIKYAPPTKHNLGFDKGQEITILSKSKNVNDYWEATVDGKIGYVPSNLIKEVKVFHKVSDLIPVPVQPQQLNKPDLEENNNTLSNVPVKDEISGSKSLPPAVETSSEVNLEAVGNLNPPTQTFNVIEGTTIYEDIAATSTVDVKSTTKTASVEVPKDGRATLPPEIINLNNNYKGQLFMNEKANVIVEKNSEDVKVESADLYDEDEEENDDEEEEVEEEGEDEEEEEEEGEEENEKEQVQEQIKELAKENGALGLEKPIENVTESGVEPSVQSEAQKAEEVTVAPLEKNTHQTPLQPPTGFNLLNNFKTTPQPAKMNLLLQDSDKSNVVPQVAQSVMVDINQSEGVTHEPVSTSHPQTKDAAFSPLTSFSSSSPQMVAQASTLNEFTSAQTPTVAEETISTQFTVSAVTPPGNANYIEPQLEEVTTETSLVTPQPISDKVSQLESFTEIPVNKEGKEPGVERTTEAFATTPQPVVPEIPSLNLPAGSSESPPIGEPFKKEPTLDVIQEETEVPTVGVSEDTEVPKPTEIPETEVTEPVVIETAPPQTPQSVVEEKAEVEETVALPEGGEDGSAMAQITNMFSSWFTSTPKEQLPPDDVVQESRESLADSKTVSDTCENGLGFDCKNFSDEEQSSGWIPWISWIPGGVGVDSFTTSTNTFLYLVVTAVTVLLFTLGHNFIEKRGKTGPLIAKINKLEQELLVASKECSLLKDEVQSVRDKITLYENSANDELVLSLQAELEESKRVKAELESSIEVLQQELDAATEAGLDLNKMLSEVLTQKGGSETLLKSVENLQSQLDRQQQIIDEMTKKLGAKNEENEALQSALEAANEKSENLEEQLNEIKHNLNLHLKEKENLTQDLNCQITQLKTRINQLGQAKEKEIAKLKKESEEMQKKLVEATGKLTMKEEEVQSLKEAMKKLKTKQDLKLDVVFDVCRVNGELEKEKKENGMLAEKLKKEEAEKKAVADSMKLLEAETQKLRKAYEEAEQKKEEAEKKLEVLSTYFKEKETQLQKELGLQEALWAQKKGDEKAVYNMMKSLQEEVDSYKSQNETLKKEILDQERGLKSQMATLEQKAHENWVAARQAERKLEEAKQEMAQLRNRLTLAEKNSYNEEGKSGFRSEELNGVEAASPILHDTSSPLLFPPLPLDPTSSNLLPPGFMPPPMFMPPPIGGFMPPPPFLPGDRRPPPLGRMSSPPLNNRFSPSSPADYPFERMSSPPLSPSAANYRSANEERDRYKHRSPPYPPPPLHARNWEDSSEMPGFIPISSQRESRRDHKGSNISSEHSSSESLEKSSRHSGRV